MRVYAHSPLPIAQLSRSIFENSFVGFILFREDGLILDINSKACLVLGYCPTELVGNPLSQVLIEDIPELFDFSPDNQANKKRPGIPLQTKNNGTFLADIECSPIAGEPKYAYLMFQETSSQEPLNNVLASIPDDLYKYRGTELYEKITNIIGSQLGVEYVVIGMINEETRAVDVQTFWSNGEFISGVSYPLLNSPCGSVLHTKTLHRYGKDVRDLFPHEQSLVNLNVNSYVGLPLFNSEKKVIGILAVMSQEVQPAHHSVEQILRMYADRIASEMDREKGERALKESEERFRTLFNNMPLAIGIRDLEAERITDCNPRLLELFGLTREQVIGRLRNEDTIEEDDELRLELSQQLIKGEIPRFSTEKVYRTQYGTDVHCRTTRSLMRISEQDYVIGILEDITKEKEVEAQLRDKIRELEEKSQELQQYIDSNLQLENFAYFASHDMKEPLRTIASFSQLLEKRYRDQLDEDGKTYLQFIVGGVKSMNALINDLLSYARVSRENQEQEKVNPRHMILEIVKNLDRYIQDAGAMIQIGRLPEWIICYRTNVSQLFQNLISNAIKFRKPGQPAIIQIEGKEVAGVWEFDVSDNGIGIEDRFHQQIFRMFRKLHTRSEYEGTGIGLALCKKVSEQHKGTISVQSEMGKGTRFTFTLSKKL